MLHDIMKLCPSAIYSEKILQRLFIHLKSPFCCPKTLISVLNLARVNNRGTLLGCFYQRITFLFLNTSGGCLDSIFYHLERLFLTTFLLSIFS